LPPPHAAQPCRRLRRLAADIIAAIAAARAACSCHEVAAAAMPLFSPCARFLRYASLRRLRRVPPIARVAAFHADARAHTAAAPAFVYAMRGARCVAAAITRAIADIDTAMLF